MSPAAAMSDTWFQLAKMRLTILLGYSSIVAGSMATCLIFSRRHV